MKFANSGVERGLIRVESTAWNFPREDVSGEAVLLDEDELVVFSNWECEGPVGKFEGIESAIFS